MNSVNHYSWGQLVLSFQGSERMWTMKSYMKLAKKEVHVIFFLLGVGEAKFRFCLLGRMVFVWIS
jgi:hypothetical protein